MKGKQWEGKDHHANTLFANMRQNPNFQHHQPPQHQPLNPHHHYLNLHHFQTSQEQEEQTDTHTTTTTTKDPPTAAASDGATIEIPRRPRGRPPGSKNKPKPPIIITHLQPEPNAMNPYILEVPTGLDLVHSITQFSKKRNTAIRVLSATGTVSNVTLRQPAVVSAAVTFHGRFDLLSLSATVFPSPTTTSFSRGNIHEFCISLGGPGGQVVGGTVVGPLYAAATVYVVAASFNNPSFHRLPVEEEGEFRSCGDGEDNEGRSSPQVEHGGGYSGREVAAAAGEGCGAVSFYGGGQLGSDQVIWAPAARVPPPPPPY